MYHFLSLGVRGGRATLSSTGLIVRHRIRGSGHEKERRESREKRRTVCLADRHQQPFRMKMVSMGKGKTPGVSGKLKADTGLQIPVCTVRAWRGEAQCLVSSLRSSGFLRLQGENREDVSQWDLRAMRPALPGTPQDHYDLPWVMRQVCRMEEGETLRILERSGEEVGKGRLPICLHHPGPGPGTFLTLSRGLSTRVF